jgi:hypothetical protein
VHDNAKEIKEITSFMFWTPAHEAENVLSEFRLRFRFMFTGLRRASCLSRNLAQKFTKLLPWFFEAIKRTSPQKN